MCTEDEAWLWFEGADTKIILTEDEVEISECAKPLIYTSSARKVNLPPCGAGLEYASFTLADSHGDWTGGDSDFNIRCSYQDPPSNVDRCSEQPSGGGPVAEANPPFLTGRSEVFPVRLICD